MSNDKHDIIIPLSTKSFENKNFEIRVTIASIRKYCKFVNRIIIVSQTPKIKSLGDDIIWIYQDDPYEDKDANIIEKIRKAIETIPDLTDDFVFWSDDQFITKDTEWSDTQPRYMKIYDKPDMPYFLQEAAERIWFQRLIQTFERFPNKGIGCKFFNPHIPSPMNKHKFLEMCNTFNYREENGIIIFSLYYNFIGEEGVPNFDEFHCEEGELDWNDCRWVGYFDSSMSHTAFIQKLYDMFLKK
jgi:hypothetical protein